MQDKPIRRRDARQGHVSARGAVRAGAVASLLCAGLLGAPADAVEVSSLYTAQVPWSPDDAAGREDAYDSALREVLVRVTGARGAASDPQLLALFPEPASFVSGYREGPNRTLWVSFDGRGVSDTLRLAGAPVWGSDRPLTLVWLAIDRGPRGRSLVGASDSDVDLTAGRSADPNNFLRQRLEATAAQRGIPVAFPLIDASDREGVDVADVWGGFDERILAASERYAAPSVLIGRASVAGQDARVRWSWHYGGSVDEFSGSVEQATHRVADALAAQLAISGATERHNVALFVRGLDGVAAYGRVLRLLNALPQIQQTDVVSAFGDTVEFRVQCVGSADSLARALESGGVLLEEQRFDRREPLVGGRAPQADPGPAPLAAHERVPEVGADGAIDDEPAVPPETDGPDTAAPPAVRTPVRPPPVDSEFRYRYVAR